MTALAFSPDSSLLVSGGVDRRVRAFRMRDGSQAWSQRGHRDDVLCLAWESPKQLVSGGADGALLHWQADGGRAPALPALGEWVYDLAVSSDGSQLVTADWSGRLAVVALESRKLVTSCVPLGIAESPD